MGPFYTALQGMNKHKLLRADVFPAMASNRKVQRLLKSSWISYPNTSPQTNPEQKNPTPAASSLQTKDAVDSNPSLIDETNFRSKCGYFSTQTKWIELAQKEKKRILDLFHRAIGLVLFTD